MYLPIHTFLQGGKYRIDAFLGQGGFGITYRAVWNTAANTSFPVAIKEFFLKECCARMSSSNTVTVSGATGSSKFYSFKQKLLKECAILFRLNHPNIVRVFDIFEENNTAYMVMEYVDGRSLKQIIENRGRLSESAAMYYLSQLCNALVEVHSHGILHLDVKPGNILIDGSNRVRLIDFGISKNYDSHGSETSTTPVGVSKGFSPIEQYSGLVTFQPTADVYALGATVYNMLTGVTPVEAVSRVGMGDHTAPVSAYNPQISTGMRMAVEKAMAISPADRFQSVAAFWHALNGNGGEIKSVKPESKPWLLWGGIAACALVLAILTGVIIGSANSKGGEKEAAQQLLKATDASRFDVKTYSGSASYDNDNTTSAYRSQDKETASRAAEVYASSTTPGRYPEASERRLTDEDVRGLSKWELKIMRNEIFARHHYIFKSPDLIKHFSECNWYEGLCRDEEVAYNEMSGVEKDNIELIKRYEKQFN
jgi:serine/threonine protein kinase